MSVHRPRPKFYTISNVAGILGVSRQRVHSLIKTGLLHLSDAPGVGRVIRADELDRFQRERATKSRPKRAPRRHAPVAKGAIAPPVHPFPLLLNLSNLNTTWQDFENFCEAFISCLPDVKEVHFYGRRGGRQKGVDFIADMKNGQHWAFQARGWKTFNKGHVEKAIAETTYVADRYVLLVSPQVGSEERDVCVQNGKWDIWDERDISRKVRHEIAPSDAARLVEAHFGPQWRKDFLGLPGVEAFVAPEEYFRLLLDPKKLFNHHWSIVGRAGTIKALTSFVNSGEHSVAILSGRGGIGKSKILHEFAQDLASHHKEYVVRFLDDGVRLTPDMLDHVPVSPLAILIDDAHRSEDLRAALSFARQRQLRHPNHPLKLILSTRPQGIGRVRTFLTEANYDPREIAEIPEVKDLSRDDVRELARQALGSTSPPQLVERLAAATRDSPLVTLVGGRLLKERRMDPALLENDDEFRQAVLTRFQDEALGVISEKLEAQTARGILQLVAALAPINFSVDSVAQKASEFLRIDRVVLLRTVGLLEAYGILIRRGRLVRITPDVLADHILRESCINAQGVPTGYAYQVFRYFSGVQPANVLRNLAELDWRMHHTIGDSGLLDAIWGELEKEFRNAPSSGRCVIIDILEEVAYFQPRRVLSLVEFAMHNPAQAPEDPEVQRLSALYQYSHKDVLNRLPKLLRRISFNLDFLSRCCDLLWELGRDDPRELNPNPDHPIRVLTDLAGYDIDKPLVVHERVLAAASQWLSAPDAHDHRYSPMDVIEPLFAKTAHSTYSEGHSFVLRPFKIHRENTKALRMRALELIVVCSQSSNIKVVFKALEVLEEALRDPMSLFGQEISDSERRLWIPDQLEIIEALEQIASGSEVPLITLRVLEILRWYTKYESSEPVRERAREVTSKFKTSSGIGLFRVLKESFDLESEDGDEDEPYERRERASTELRRAVANEFLDEFPETDNGFSQLNKHLALFAQAGVQHNASAFLYELSQARPKYAAQLCATVIQQARTHLSTYFAVLLSGVRKTNPQQAIGLVKQALDTENQILCRSVADGYRVWLDNLEVEDIAVVGRLLSHRDQNVKALAIMALERLGRRDPGLAKELALTVDIGDSAPLAERMSELFDPKYGIPLESLSDDELRIVVKKLEPVLDLDDYHVSEFLSNASTRIPAEVVQLFLDRISRSADTVDNGYRPLPYHFHHRMQGVALFRGYENLLKKVRSLALRKGWRPRHWGAHLFKELSLGYSPQTLTVLAEWIDSERDSKIEAAASLLREADSDFVFDNRDFVVKLIQKAHVAGEECLKKVVSHLFASAISGVRSSAPGEPAPQDVALRDRASSVARELVQGSPEHRFYDELAKHADQTIRSHLVEDEEIFE